jgi:hypothetical protein
VGPDGERQLDGQRELRDVRRGHRQPDRQPRVELRRRRPLRLPVPRAGGEHRSIGPAPHVVAGAPRPVRMVRGERGHRAPDGRGRGAGREHADRLGPAVAGRERGGRGRHPAARRARPRARRRRVSRLPAR